MKDLSTLKKLLTLSGIVTFVLTVRLYMECIAANLAPLSLTSFMPLIISCIAYVVILNSYYYRKNRIQYFY